MTKSTETTVGRIDKQDYGNAHQLQLWVSRSATGWQWKLCNAYVPGGRLGRPCELEGGSNADYTENRRLGQAAFDRVKAEELAKIPPAGATASGAASS
ncbi:MAG: hypothetical protein SGJ27_31120 [Candidatus Melainabacteria bacterium]|nr:hypothetical protein [Candidatus Melainabacteria bacterium]